MCNFPSGKIPKVRLGLLSRSRLQWGGGRAPWLEQGRGRVFFARKDLKVAAREIAHAGSCLLGKYPWEDIA